MRSGSAALQASLLWATLHHFHWSVTDCKTHSGYDAVPGWASCKRLAHAAWPSTMLFSELTFSYIGTLKWVGQKHCPIRYKTMYAIRWGWAFTGKALIFDVTAGPCANVLTQRFSTNLSSCCWCFVGIAAGQRGFPHTYSGASCTPQWLASSRHAVHANPTQVSVSIVVLWQQTRAVSVSCVTDAHTLQWFQVALYSVDECCSKWSWQNNFWMACILQEQPWLCATVQATSVLFKVFGRFIIFFFLNKRF